MEYLRHYNGDDMGEVDTRWDGRAWRAHLESMDSVDI